MVYTPSALTEPPKRPGRTSPGQSGAEEDTESPGYPKRLRNRGKKGDGDTNSSSYHPSPVDSQASSESFGQMQGKKTTGNIPAQATPAYVTRLDPSSVHRTIGTHSVRSVRSVQPMGMAPYPDMSMGMPAYASPMPGMSPVMGMNPMAMGNLSMYSAELSQSIYDQVQMEGPWLDDGDHTGMVYYPKRWMLACCLAVLNVVACVQWVEFSPLQDMAKRTYDLSDSDILLQLLFLVYPIVFMCGTVGASQLLSAFGLITPAVGSGFLLLLGGWFKYSSNLTNESMPKFLLVYFGQILSALGYPCIPQAMMRLIGPAFKKVHRPVVLCFVVESAFAGFMLGYLLVPFSINMGPSDEKGQVERHLLTMAVGSTLAFLGAAYGLMYVRIQCGRDNDTQVESVERTGMIDDDTAPSTFLGRIHLIPSSLVPIIGVVIGSFIAAMALLTSIGQDEVNSPMSGRMFGFLYSTGAMLGAGLLNVTLTYSADDKKIISGSLGLMTMGWILSLFAFEALSGSESLAGVSFILIGLGSGAVEVLALEIVSEVFRFYGSDMAFRYTYLIGYGVGTVLTLVFLPLPRIAFVGVVTGLTAIATFMSTFYKRDDDGLNERYAYYWE
eukprot:GFYU01007855.1.p1 GENE.GFYU01007855.1~~GFYU01007855.1.p1  ORF type:complete len:611 (+),score=101.32 GFYU01007855.1:315-2147(+)